MDDDADVLEGSLQTLYGYTPIVYSSGGSLWTYNGPPDIHSTSSPEQTDLYNRMKINLRIPDTSAKNWNLHASSVWVASIFIANEICSNPNWLSPIFPRTDGLRKGVRVLEIGAGAGLPSIVLVKSQSDILDQVVVSDYPDKGIIQALEENVERNCRGIAPESKRIISVAPFDWLDSSPPIFEICQGFDLIIGADVLWNSDLHIPMLAAIDRCLKKEVGAKTLLVAGLHTGRYTIQRFVERVGDTITLRVERIEEREVDGSTVREWEAQRQEHETEEERRHWVVCVWLGRCG